MTDYRTLRVQTANFLHNHSRPMRRRFMVVTEHRVVWDLIMSLSVEKDVLTHWLMKRGELVTIGLPPTVATVFCNTIQEMEILWTTFYAWRFSRRCAHSHWRPLFRHKALNVGEYRAWNSSRCVRALTFNSFELVWFFGNILILSFSKIYIFFYKCSCFELSILTKNTVTVSTND